MAHWWHHFQISRWCYPFNKHKLNLHSCKRSCFIVTYRAIFSYLTSHQVLPPFHYTVHIYSGLAIWIYKILFNRFENRMTLWVLNINICIYIFFQYIQNIIKFFYLIVLDFLIIILILLITFLFNVFIGDEKKVWEIFENNCVKKVCVIKIFLRGVKSFILLVILMLNFLRMYPF